MLFPIFTIDIKGILVLFEAVDGFRQSKTDADLHRTIDFVVRGLYPSFFCPELYYPMKRVLQADTIHHFFEARIGLDYSL